jgi:hypothetical protein
MTAEDLTDCANNKVLKDLSYCIKGEKEVLLSIHWKEDDGSYKIHPEAGRRLLIKLGCRHGKYIGLYSWTGHKPRFIGPNSVNTSLHLVLRPHFLVHFV